METQTEPKAAPSAPDSSAEPDGEARVDERGSSRGLGIGSALLITAGVGLGAASLATGVLWAKTGGDYRGASDPNATSYKQELEQTARTQSAVAWATGATGVVALGVGVALLVVRARRGRTQPTPSARLILSPTHGGVGLGGEF